MATEVNREPVEEEDAVTQEDIPEEAAVENDTIAQWESMSEEEKAALSVDELNEWYDALDVAYKAVYQDQEALLSQQEYEEKFGEGEPQLSSAVMVDKDGNEVPVSIEYTEYALAYKDEMDKFVANNISNQMGSVVGTFTNEAVPEGWDIQRDVAREAIGNDQAFEGMTDEEAELAKKVYGIGNNHKSIMSFDQFVDEWNAMGLNRGPTQQEYELWITHGNPGQMYAQLSGSGYKLLDNPQGNDIPVYTQEALSYAQQNDYSLDKWIEDDSVMIISKDSDISSLDDDWSEVPWSDQQVSDNQELTDQFTIYSKSENIDWYQEDWFVVTLSSALAIATAGAGAAAGAVVSAGLGSVAGVAAGAAVGGIVGANVAAATSLVASGGSGADISSAVESGFIRGAIGGGFSAGIDAAGIGLGDAPIENAITRGIQASVTDVALGDSEDALGSFISGGTSALIAADYGAQAGVLTKAAIDYGITGEIDLLKLSAGVLTATAGDKESRDFLGIDGSFSLFGN